MRYFLTITFCLALGSAACAQPILTIWDTLAPPKYLPTTQEQFGVSVASEGDYLVVGSPSREVHNGRAYVYHFQEGQWVLQATLRSSFNNDNSRTFGTKVAISNGTIAVMANYDLYTVEDLDNTGGLFIFEEPPGGWANATETTFMPPPTGHRFHHRDHLALGNDFVVATYSELYSPIGTVLYEKPAEGWAAPLGPPVSLGINFLDFGLWSLAAGNDVVALGIPGTNSGRAGQVLLYTKPANGWQSTNNGYTVLRPFDSNSADEFGYALDIRGNALAVGSPNHSVNFRNTQNAAYVFETASGNWNDARQVTVVSPPHFGNNIHHGDAVALSPDGEALTFMTHSLTCYGYRAEKGAGAWNAAITADSAFVINPEGEPFGLHHMFVYSLTGTRHGLVMGNPGQYPEGYEAGTVHFMPTGKAPDSLILPPPPDLTNAFIWFGSRIVLDDGTLLVGGPAQDGQRGQLFLYEYGGQSATYQASLALPHQTVGSEVGWAADLNGPYLAAADRHTGNVHLYKKAGATWANNTYLGIVPTAPALGQQLVLEEDVLAIESNGTVLLYEPGPGGWDDVAGIQLATTLPGGNAQRGRNIVFSGNLLALGIPAIHGVAVYTRPGNSWAQATEVFKVQGSLHSVGQVMGFNGHTLAVTRYNDNRVWVYKSPNGLWTDGDFAVTLKAGSGTAFTAHELAITDSLILATGEQNGQTVLMAWETNGDLATNQPPHHYVATPANPGTPSTGWGSLAVQGNNMVFGVATANKEEQQSGTAYLLSYGEAVNDPDPDPDPIDSTQVPPPTCNQVLESLTLYPNPSTGLVTLVLPASYAQHTQYRVLNTLGQEVAVPAYRLQEGEDTHWQFHFGGNRKGVYYVMLALACGQVPVPVAIY